MSQERVCLIKSLGAKIVPVRRDQGGFLGSIRMTEELAKQDPHVFLPAQFANEANVEAHEKTTGGPRSGGSWFPNRSSPMRSLPGWVSAEQ
jgi:cysteine synthase A